MKTIRVLQALSWEDKTTVGPVVGPKNPAVGKPRFGKIHFRISLLFKMTSTSKTWAATPGTKRLSTFSNDFSELHTFRKKHQISFKGGGLSGYKLDQVRDGKTPIFAVFFPDL